MVFSYIVGNFYVVGKTLWGSLKSSSQCRIWHKKFPTMLVLSTKKKLPHCVYRKFGYRILRCGELIFVNYHQTFHGKDENLQCGELCKHSYLIMIYLHLFWIVTHDIILHCEEDSSNQWYSRTSPQWRISMWSILHYGEIFWWKW